MLLVLPVAAMANFDFNLQVNASQPLQSNLKHSQTLWDLSERQLDCIDVGYSPCDSFESFCCPTGGVCCISDDELVGQWPPIHRQNKKC